MNIDIVISFDDLLKEMDHEVLMSLFQASKPHVRLGILLGIGHHVVKLPFLVLRSYCHEKTRPCSLDCENSNPWL